MMDLLSNGIGEKYTHIQVSDIYITVKYDVSTKKVNSFNLMASDSVCGDSEYRFACMTAIVLF